MSWHRTLPPHSKLPSEAWAHGATPEDEPRSSERGARPKKNYFGRPAYEGRQILVLKTFVLRPGPDGKPWVHFHFQSGDEDGRGVPREAMISCGLKRTEYPPDTPRATHLDLLMYILSPEKKVPVDASFEMLIGRCLVGDVYRKEISAKRKQLKDGTWKTLRGASRKALVSWKNLESAKPNLKVKKRTVY